MAEIVAANPAQNAEKAAKIRLFALVLCVSLLKFAVDIRLIMPFVVKVTFQAKGTASRVPLD